MNSATLTTIDWFRYRTQSEPRDVAVAMAPLFGEHAHLVHLGGWDRGMWGFHDSAQLLIEKVPVARLDYGGQSQRGWVRVDMSGRGCGFVTDWDAGVEAMEALQSAQVRRLDIALTTWDGEIRHQDIVSAHRAGKFGTGGKPPALKQITSSEARAGRTCYVGSRENPKFFRGYEKGYELLAKLRIPGGVETVKFDGHPVEDIYRCELELKANGITIGWDTIERRDEFFAGAYPFCREILPGIDPDVLQRRPEKAPQRELAAALMNCRIQYGNTLYTALKAYQGDIGAVWEKVCGHEDNKHLVEAGVLLYEPEGM